MKTVSPAEFQEHWKIRFFAIFAGQSASLFGSSLVQFALVWYLTRTSGSATVLATAAIFGMLPQIILGPFSGTLVDRWNRRLVMIVADSMVALVTLSLAAVFWLERAEPWHIYLALFLRSAAGGFHWTAMSASLVLMVPKNQLTRIAGWQQALQGAIQMAAPPAGALLLEILHTQGVLAVDVGTALLAILPLLFIPIPQPAQHPHAANKPASYGAMLREGLQYVRGWRSLLAVMALAMAINFLLAPAGAFLPLLITKHFGKGALELGFTETLWGLSTIVGGIVLGIWGGFRRRIATTLLGIIGIGSGILLTGLAPATAFWLALLGIGLAGFMQVIANGPLQAIFQAVIAPEMQGRVMSLIGSAVALMSPLALAISGPLADTFGIRTWYLLGGTFSLLLGIGSYFIPLVMQLETHRPAPAPASDTPAVAPPENLPATP